MPSRPKKGELVRLRFNATNPAHNPYRITQSRRENRGPAPATPRRIQEALLSDPNREIIRDMLMKFNAKAKSFHVAVQGNSPQHVTLPSRILIRLLADKHFATINRRDQRNHHPDRLTINGLSTGHPDIESTTLPPTSDRPSVPMSDPTSKPSSESSSRSRKRSEQYASRRAYAASKTSKTTVDRDGDGRIREELESLGGR